MPHRILAVDDEEAIRVMLQQFLTTLGYEVDTAQDGVEALDMLEKSAYDLVLSDINMPRMKGFELLQKVREKHPGVKRALITAYDVNDYLKLAMEHDVGSIIPKSTPPNFDEIRTVVQNLLSEDFFGLAHYMRPGCKISQASLTRHEQIKDISREVSSLAQEPKAGGKIALVVNELLTNAMFYGARREKDPDKTSWETDFELPLDRAVHAFWGDDKEKIGFSVVDGAGKLAKKDVLHWLCRQVERDDQGVPVGVFDTHGRGFFIARNYVDSLIINIKADIRTEVVGLAYRDRNASRHKPLYINEI